MTLVRYQTWTLFYSGGPTPFKQLKFKNIMKMVENIVYIKYIISEEIIQQVDGYVVFVHGLMMNFTSL